MMSFRSFAIPTQDPSVKNLTGKQGTLKLLQYVNAHIAERNEVLLTSHAIVFVIAGRKMLHFSDNSFEVKSGEIFLLPRGEYVMSEYLPADGNFQSVMLFFDEEVVWPVLTRLGKELRELVAHSSKVQVISNEPSFGYFFKTLVEYSQSNSPYLYELMELKFNELIYLLLGGTSKSAMLNFLLSIIQREKPTLERVLQEYMFSPLTLDELSALSGRSLASFKRDFVTLYKEAPHRWLVNKRLEKASFMLRNTLKNVDEIADECGFQTSSNMSRLFKSKYGKAPTKYRAEKTSF